MHKWFKISTQL